MMRVCFIVLLTLTAVFPSSAQNYDFKIMAWNVKWFGDPIYCSCDTAQQRLNVEAVLQIEKPDIVALQEIIDINRLQALADKLDYHMIVSPYGSLAPDTNSGHYARAQKLAFLYKKSNIYLLENYGLTRSTYPLYSNNNSPYYYFASGRFPFLASFDLSDGLVHDTLTLVNIHAKASSTNNDYLRRQKGAVVMQDSLDKLYPNKKVLILGDYNDLLEGSTVSSQSFSPYQYNINQGYVPMTKSSQFPGQTTYVYSSGDILDNFLGSPSFATRVKNSSVEILSRVSNYITSYASTTSDHYPIMLKYISSVANLLSSTSVEKQMDVRLRISGDFLYLTHTSPLSGTVYVSNLQGQLLKMQELSSSREVLELSGIAPQPILVVIKVQEKTLCRQMLMKTL